MSPPLRNVDLNQALHHLNGLTNEQTVSARSRMRIVDTRLEVEELLKRVREALQDLADQHDWDEGFPDEGEPGHNEYRELMLAEVEQDRRPDPIPWEAVDDFDVSDGAAGPAFDWLLARGLIARPSENGASD